jgi:hypothetical protein
LQSTDFVDHCITASGHSGNFSLNLVGFNEVVSHVDATGGDQHGAAYSHSA